MGLKIKVPRMIRKRLATYIVTAMFIPFLASLGVPDEVLQWVTNLAMAYIGGQSLSDAAYAFNNKKYEAGEDVILTPEGE